MVIFIWRKGDTWVDRELLELKIAYENSFSDVEKQEIANRAAQIRNDNPGGYHVDPNKPLDYYIIYDVTDQLMAYMRSNAWNYAYLRNSFIKDKYTKFIYLVGNGKEMDLKN